MILGNYYFIFFIVFFIVCERFCKPRNKSIYFPRLSIHHFNESKAGSYAQTFKIAFFVFFSLCFSVVENIRIVFEFMAFFSLLIFAFLRNWRQDDF